MNNLKVLVMHSLGDPKKASSFLINHVAALIKYYPEHSYVYHDTTTNSPDSLTGVHFDAIVFDVTFWTARWAEDNRMIRLKIDYAFIKDTQAIKIALPQDEYDCSEILDRWLCEWKIDVVFSVIDGYWDILYPNYSKMGKIKLGYTGYIDNTLLSYKIKPWSQRAIDIGYRAKKLPPYFGYIGENKWRIGEVVRNLAKSSGIIADISLGDEGTLLGDDWLSFINNCKFTLGAVSGSSLLDPVGAIQRSVRSYILRYPEATYEEVRAECFAGKDGIYEFTAISPRVLEAGMLESCQILTEGVYSGILEPWQDYIPLKSNGENFEDVTRAMKDFAFCSKIINNCKLKLLENKALRYDYYAKSILDVIIEHKC
jgi:hypothetical protein